MSLEEPPLEQLNRIIADFNAGRHAEVLVQVKSLLGDFPASGFAWQILGVSQRALGAESLFALQRAVKLLPGDAEAHCNLGITLAEMKRYPEAEVAFGRAVALDPGFINSHFQLGLMRQAAGQADLAAVSFRRVLELDPRRSEIHNRLGDLWLGSGRFEEAEQAFRQALALDPANAQLHYNLGVAEQHLGRLEEALAHYRTAVASDPRLTLAFYNMGIALHALGHREEALAAYQNALDLQPDYPDALNNQAIVYRELGRLDEARANYEATLQLDPGNPQANLILKAIYMQQKRLVDAEALCRRALEVAPDFAEMHQNLAVTRAYLSDFQDVVGESDRAFQLQPDHAVMWEQRLYSFSYHSDLSAEEIFREFVKWGDRFPDPDVDFSGHNCDPHRRLRIGYVSPDFRRHTSRFYFWPLFSNHDKTAVELFAYSNVRFEDAFTRLFKGQFEHWRDIKGLDDEAVADLVRADGIDILVDVCSHMQDDRLGVFTLKPAPIQATWLGAAWTTGLKTVDYAVFDPHVAPVGTLTREEIVRLPHSFMVFQPPEDTADLVPAPCLKNGFVTFGYSGRTERLNHRTFRVWGEILQRLPQARLILDFGPFAEPGTQAYYRTFLAEHGVDVERVIFRKSPNIFEGLNDIDILLDSFPHSGGTMLLDAFWMGVPALTLAGRPPVGRLGVGMLMNLGLPDWIAATEADYVDKACAFASRPEDLNTLRLGLRERLKASPLMDGPGFARAFEDAYREMFRKWLQGPTREEMKGLYDLFHAGRVEEAEDQALDWVRRCPAAGLCWKVLGVARLLQGKDSLPFLFKATDLLPDDAVVHYNLGVALQKIDERAAAEACYRRALELDPDNARTLHNLFLVLIGQGRLTEAEACARQALTVAPDTAQKHQNLAMALAYLSDYEQVVPQCDEALRREPDSPQIWEERLYAFSYHPDLSAEAIYAEFARWGDRFPVPETDFSGHDRSLGRRLQVGYVSPDFRRHTSRFYFLPLFLNHDPEAVELFAYSNVLFEDEFTERFKGRFDHWRDIRGVGDEAVAELVREDRIDILVDVCNHMQDHRLGVFALKPAPVQATWLGAAWTTGLPSVDHVLFDPHVAPEGTLAREHIVRLPKSFMVFQPPEQTAEVTHSPCLKNGSVTFGYTGRTERLNHRTFRVWGEILKGLPEARLILDFGPFADPGTQAHYRTLLARHGVDVDRVILRKSPNIFEGLNDIDILLDSFPHSGGTMLLDAFWMGVPALSLAGRPPVGRLGTGMLMNLGLPEWIAATEAEYVAKACAFASDPHALNELRLGLRERMKASPLMDGAGFARDVEAAYRMMFERWVAQAGESK